MADTTPAGWARCCGTPDTEGDHAPGRVPRYEWLAPARVSKGPTETRKLQRLRLRVKLPSAHGELANAPPAQEPGHIRPDARFVSIVPAAGPSKSASAPLDCPHREIRRERWGVLGLCFIGTKATGAGGQRPGDLRDLRGMRGMRGMRKWPQRRLYSMTTRACPSAQSGWNFCDASRICVEPGWTGHFGISMKASA